MPALEPHWWWLAAAGMLAIAEIIAPGIFLIWLAAAAAVTGILSWLIPGLEASLGLQLVAFAILAFISVYIGRTIMRLNPPTSADPLLNNRAARLVGEIALVIEPISEGSGRIQVGDSPWLATGTDAKPGEKVRIIGAKGTTLQVEPLSPKDG